MADATAGEEWVIDRLFGQDPAPIGPEPEVVDSRGDEPDKGTAALIDYSSAQEPETAASDDDHRARRAAVWLAAVVGALALLMVIAFSLYGSHTRPGTPGDSISRPAAAILSAAPHTTVSAPPPDQAIPFTAAAPGCKSGSTPAQSLSDTAGERPWVCARGTPDEQADGQVLHIDFRCDTAQSVSMCSYLVTSVAVTPGAVTPSTTGRDEWLTHRVVSRLQYNFYNGDDLVDILTQDTGNVHGPASAAVRHPVLASHVVVIILQTARPPASPLPSSAAAQTVPGLPDAQVTDTAVPASPSAVSDPVDAAFAMSGLQFFGHTPK